MTAEEYKDFKGQFKSISYTQEGNVFLRNVLLDYLNKIVRFNVQLDVDVLELQGLDKKRFIEILNIIMFSKDLLKFGKIVEVRELSEKCFYKVKKIN